MIFYKKNTQQQVLETENKVIKFTNIKTGCYCLKNDAGSLDFYYFPLQRGFFSVILIDFSYFRLRKQF